MPITFENDNDVIVYALEKVISYARHNKYIFLAQSVWWIVSIIGLQQELIDHIDHQRVRSEVRSQEIRELPMVREVTCQAETKEDQLDNNQNNRALSATPRDIQEDN